MRRSDRYKDSEDNKVTRVNKNKYTYEEINSKIGFDAIPSYEADMAVDLSSLDIDKLNRNQYHQIKDYKELLDENKEIPEDNSRPKKIVAVKEYDINKVLEEAKSNRKADELEGKRKVENISSLNTLNRKYLYEKGFTEEDSQELKELIDTITSKKLSDDIKDDEEKELLSDLLATTIDIKLEKELSKEDLDKIIDEKIGLTDSFYTKSMELTDEDLLDDDENDENEDNEEEKDGTLKIILITALLFISFITVIYFILKYYNLF